jgi:hypothetical protein
MLGLEVHQQNRLRLKVLNTSIGFARLDNCDVAVSEAHIVIEDRNICADYDQRV